jgi:uncharacterized protein (TIGR00645 family)
VSAKRTRTISPASSTMQTLVSFTDTSSPAGYENFVSRIDPGGHPDWPHWMARIDFTGLKQKLLASIVAISAIQVLKAFMNIDAGVSNEKLGWLVGIHLVFVISTVLLAWSDRIGAYREYSES